MRKFLVSLAFLMIAAVLIAGCTTQNPAPQPVTTPATLPPTVVVTATPVPPVLPAQLTRNWVVTTMAIQDGTAITYPTTEISLTFNPDGSFTGYDGCNNYFGSATPTGITTQKGNGMTISNIASSKKYCESLAQQETKYLALLGKTMAYNVNGNQLSMTATTGDVLISQTPATLVTPKQYSPQG
ncbi:MAG: META domain-containing protein [Bacteroidota bacterium]|nr:META domain-containing protein [Bacteroidota bacterium]